MTDITWQQPDLVNFDFTLTPATVHIWRWLGPTPETYLEQLQKLLNPEEQTRAKRFHFAKDRHQFITARGILRELLGRYLSLPAAEIIFEATRYGKPSVIGSQNLIDLHFNISHSNQCILFAFTLHTELGVDVEFPKVNIDYDGIGTRFFAPNEREQLARLEGADKCTGFYNAWTRKEAYIKAIGEGLSHPLEDFDVTLIPGEPASLTRVAHNPEQLNKWALVAFSPAKGYFAALAVPKQKPQIAFYDWRARD